MIEKVTLIRLEKTDAGTFGVLLIDRQAVCVTLEPPDKGNASDISCIPEGIYQCKKVDSPHFGATYEITDVPERTNILFHPGNIRADTHGCVLLGRQYGLLGGDRAILHSGATFKDFLSTAAGVEGFELSVTDVSGISGV